MIPRSEEELSKIIREARNTATPLRIIGGGTRLSLGNPIRGEALSLTGFSGITRYEPETLSLVVKAGTSMAEIQSVLDQNNQMLPFEPLDHRQLFNTQGEPTIGGVVASGAAGSRRLVAGSVRDSLLGVTFVDGRGDILKNGGRVMKNVTGYDLVKLLAGSYGTLGVMTEFAFRVLPKPETTITLVAQKVSEEAAVKAMSDALGSPFGVSGASYFPETASCYLRLEGAKDSVLYRAEAIAKRLDRFGKWERGAFDWAELAQFDWLSKTEGDIWSLSLKPSDAPFLGEKLKKIGAQYAYDWGGGRIWAATPPQINVREMMTMKGHASLLRANPDFKAKIGAFHPEAAPIALLSKSIRQKFDPDQILNRGIMG